MRFLRRGGRGELPVEVEDAPADGLEGEVARVGDDDEATAPPEGEATTPPEDVEAAEPDDDPAAQSEDAVTTEPDEGAADEPEDAVGVTTQHDEATPQHDDAVTAEPDEVVAAVTEGEAVQPDAPADADAVAASRGPDEAVEAESDAAPAEVAPEAPDANDEEGLARLVAGVARTSEEPTATAGEPIVDTRPAPGRSPAAAFLIADDQSPDPLADGRPAGLRLASLHLRTGQHALARAELEAFAGRGRLDEAALLDLAEVRWRMGDLSGAGDAANALLARGTEAPLALVIAAESVAAAGRPSEARRLSARALEVADGPLDPLFAGMPRAMIWPTTATPEPSAAAPRRRGRRAKGEAEGAPSTAAEAFAGGRAALAKGDSSRAALLLGVAMRLEPGFAEDVLRAVAGRDDQPLLALVRGDALRLLGREAEALGAFDRARGRSSATATGSDEPSGPGLFDDDPA